MELEGRVVGEDGVAGQPGGHQVGVDGGAVAGSRGGIEPSAYPQQMTRPNVVGQQRVDRPWAPPPLELELTSEILPGEYGVLCEELLQLHT